MQTISKYASRIGYIIVISILIFGMIHPSNVVSQTNSGRNTALVPNATTGNILLFSAMGSTYDTNISSVLTAQGFSVTVWDISTTIPTLADLTPYDVVFVGTDLNPVDTVQAGNVLASYVDQGGKVILTEFSWYAGVDIGGTMNTTGYSPFTTGTYPFSTATYSGGNSHSILSGVYAFADDYVDAGLTLTTGSVLVASYDGGTIPFIALNQNGRIMGINAYFGVGVYGDRDTLLVNAINYMLRETNVLLFSAMGSTYDANISSVLSAHGFSTAVWDISTTIPTLADLTPYDVIFVGTDLNPVDTVQAGNVLASYVDQGGKVILTEFSWYAGVDIGGTMNTTGYSPFTTGTYPFSTATYSGGNSHSILSGVYAFADDYVDAGLTLTTGSVLVASYDGGTIPFIALNQNGRIMAINAYFGVGVYGDRDILLVNAINYMVHETNVLLFSAMGSTYNANVSSVLSAHGFSTTVWDISTTIPTLADLTPYPVVLVGTDLNPVDTVQAGNVLASYVDQGGKVILTEFSWYAGVDIGGTMNTTGYSPFTTGTYPFSTETYSGGQSPPILNGVNLFTNDYVDAGLTLTAGSKLLAEYDGGVPFIALNQNGRIMGINAYFGVGFSGDRDILLVNAINFMLQPNLQPVLVSAPNSMTVELGSTTTLVWNITDNDPYNYSISVTGNLVASGLWSSGLGITYDFVATATGSFNVQLIARDGHWSTYPSSLTITVVDTTNPTVSSPADVQFITGSTGNSITWSVSDLNPTNYQITVDGNLAVSAGWAGLTSIQYNVDTLSPGTHNVVITLYDGSGNSVSDTVVVTVQNVPPTTTSNPTTSSTQNPTTTSTQNPTTSSTQNPTTSSTTSSQSSSSSASASLPLPFSSVWLIAFTLSFVTYIIRRRR